MARYLMLWELDRSRIPTDPKERAVAWTTLTNMVKQDLAEGRAESWGSFVGEMKGYCLASGDDVEIAAMVQKYTPYVYFQAFAVAGIETVETTLRQMVG
jgi:hypothetical protein